MLLKFLPQQWRYVQCYHQVGDIFYRPRDYFESQYFLPVIAHDCQASKVGIKDDHREVEQDGEGETVLAVIGPR